MARSEASPEDTFSASALDEFDRCNRIWGFRKLDGIKPESKASADFGNLVHDQLEKYLKEGTPFDLTTEAGECALAGLHLLPKPKTPGMRVEKSFILLGWGHRFYGFKDVELTSGPIPLVWDHKTSSNPARWGLTEKTLPGNIQAALYAAHAMVEAGTESADLCWFYLKSKPPYRCTPIRVRVTREQIEPTLAKIKGLADEMALIKGAGLKALDLPFNPGACEDFGGCPHKARCNLSAADKARSIMSVSAQDKQALFDKLKRKAGDQGAGSAINPPAEAPPPPVNDRPKSPDGTLEWDGAAWVPVQVAPLPDAPVKKPRGRPAKPRDAEGKIIRTPGDESALERLFDAFRELFSDTE